MAIAEVPVRYWVGTPTRVKDELCPSCFLPSLIQVPYYQFVGNADLSELLLDGSDRLEVRRRFICHAGCGWERTDSL
jgi:hypothetical protein